MSVWDDEPVKRTLKTRDKEILYKNAGGKCQNCGKKIEWWQMEGGHKKAWSRGGPTNIKNSVCLCADCNRLMGTDSWEKFQKKQGKQTELSISKDSLSDLSISQLKFLADKHHVKVKGKTEGGFLSDYHMPPTKKKYISVLSQKISKEDIETALKEMPEKPKKKRKRRQSNSWF